MDRAEIRMLIDACENQRDRALVFVGYESGARAGELLKVRLRDVQFDRYGATLRVNGKTGSRRIRLIESVPDLQLWVNMHPRRSDLNAPLWPNKWNDQETISIINRFYALLQSCAKRARINKHVHPHLLRHARTTHLACVLTEAQLSEFFGWSKRGSDMPAIYVHLSGRDVDRTLLKHYDITKEYSDRERSELNPIECPRCKTKNPPGSKFCMRCSLVLSSRMAPELDSLLAKAERIQEILNRWLIEHAPEILGKALADSEIRKELE